MVASRFEMRWTVEGIIDIVNLSGGRIIDWGWGGGRGGRGGRIDLIPLFMTALTFARGARLGAHLNSRPVLQKVYRSCNLSEWHAEIGWKRNFSRSALMMSCNRDFAEGLFVYFCANCVLSPLWGHLVALPLLSLLSHNASLI